MSALLKTTLFRWYADHLHCWDVVWRMNAQRERISLRLLDWLVTNFAKHHMVFYMLNNQEQEQPLAPSSSSSCVTEPNGSCPSSLMNVHKAYRSWLKSCGKTNFDPFRRGDRFFFDGQRERPDWALKKRHLEEECDSLRAEISAKRASLLSQQQVESNNCLDKEEEEDARILEAQQKQVTDLSSLEVRLEQTVLKLAELDAMSTTVGQLNFFRWALSRRVFHWAVEHKAEIELDMASKTALRRSCSSGNDDDDERKGTGCGKRKRREGVIQLARMPDQVKRLRGALLPPSPLALAPARSGKLIAPQFGRELEEGKMKKKKKKGGGISVSFDSARGDTAVADVACIVLKLGANITFSNPKADKLF